MADLVRAFDPLLLLLVFFSFPFCEYEFDVERSHLRSGHDVQWFWGACGEVLRGGGVLQEGEGERFESFGIEVWRMGCCQYRH